MVRLVYPSVKDDGIILEKAEAGLWSGLFIAKHASELPVTVQLVAMHALLFMHAKWTASGSLSCLPGDYLSWYNKR